MSTKDLEENFRKRLEAGDLTPDPHQEQALCLLSDLLSKIIDHQNRSFLGRFLSGRQPLTAGLYLYGGVGRGKSYLMDLFFDHVPFPNKHRTHFHLFMRDVHASLLRLRKSSSTHDALGQVADQFAKQFQLLCLDEFHVTDIADAMLLKGLFEHLMSKGVWVVMTSNTAPKDLYKDGLQRESFVPFIDLIEERLVIFDMDNTQDFRLLSESLNQSYFSPLGAPARDALRNVFSHLNRGLIPHPRSLLIKGRDLYVPCATDISCRFDFSDLCDKPLGAEDYFEITQHFDHIFVENIPLLSVNRYDQVKRFINLIDMIYDQGKQFYCTAEALPQSLFPRQSSEFARTQSRLEEFRSRPVSITQN